MLRTNFLGESCETDCVGCSVVNGEMSIPGCMIFETKNFILHQDPEIPIVGFLIITSKRHFQYFHDMNEQESKELIKILKLTMDSSRNLNFDDNTEHTLIIEERSKHFHVWIFPRLEWMKSYPNSIASIRDIMKTAKEIVSHETIDNILKYIENFKQIFSETMKDEDATIK